MHKRIHSFVFGSRAVLAGLVLGALGVACGGAPDGGEHAGSTGSAVTRKPFDLGPLDFVSDYKTIWEDYNWWETVGADEADPPSTAAILSDLSEIQSDMSTLNTHLTQLQAQVQALYAVAQQSYYLQTQQQVDEQLGLAISAIDQANEWLQTGKTGPQIGFALNDSITAMTTLSQQPFWYRPDPNNPSNQVFDPRMALGAYLAALTARVGVLTIYDPSWRSVTEYQNEFGTQLQWLNQLVQWMNQRVSCWGGASAGASSYEWGLCSECSDPDPNPPYVSLLDGYASLPNSPQCLSPFFGGTQSDAQTFFSYVNFYDRYRVLDEMGQHAVQAFIPGIQAASSSWTPPIPIHLGGATYGPGTWNNPGILNQGIYCLEAAPWNPAAGQYGLEINLCGGADMVWTTPGWNSGAGTLWAKNGTASGNVPTPPQGACVEVDGWLPASSAYGGLSAEGCSGSPGEQWEIQQDGHIVWAKNTSYCLAMPSGNPAGKAPLIQPCASTQTQIWQRAIPQIVPIKL